ncbi:GH39 family glycosyl hydrolase [Paenibacillus graminis]|uniref:Glycosyl hydrolases family 39 N-terminal catalytic domain-containing protein n=1 Tax=Paenibacillus graminis TaxID=189425 RepID=A0A089M3M4_9BACL|nr:hypothetical protein [Paenibacillus graminis]AIQ67807.1 hypothetical protein PGRAT_09300 [Paenibacillus graminis]
MFSGCHQIICLPVYLTEWNSTVSHKDLMSDTCFKSAYIIKNFTENYDRLDAFGYWLLTDLLLLPQQLFHGRLGLFTYNNIKKPSYHAFSFLNKLGNERIADGDGYFITRSRTGYQILLHNYNHYDEVYAKGVSISISYHERYSHFPELTADEVPYLRSISVPKLSRSRIHASGALPIQAILEPFEIRLIEIIERFGE